MVNQDGFGDFESGGAEVAVKFHEILNFKLYTSRGGVVLGELREGSGVKKEIFLRFKV
jgi:hypothetical protein